MATIGAAAATATIQVVLRGCHGTDLFQPTRSQAHNTNPAMYTPHIVIAATKASRACPSSASRYATHAVAPSERTTLGSGDAWSTRPDTASIALRMSAITTTRVN